MTPRSNPPVAAALIALWLLAAALLAGATGCGEKGEPDLADLPTRDADPGSDFTIIGTWQGRLEQRGIRPFTVLASIRSLDDPKRNTVHYTGIDCSGNWAYLGDPREVFRFREVIDRGAGRKCKGKGLVTLAPTAANRLGYEFRGGGIVSRGTLKRQR